MTSAEFFDLLVRKYEDQPDDYVISLGHWTNEETLVGLLPRFYADIKLTVGEIRRMAKEKGA